MKAEDAWIAIEWSEKDAIVSVCVAGRGEQAMARIAVRVAARLRSPLAMALRRGRLGHHRARQAEHDRAEALWHEVAAAAALAVEGMRPGAACRMCVTILLASTAVRVHLLAVRRRWHVRDMRKHDTT